MAGYAAEADDASRRRNGAGESVAVLPFDTARASTHRIFTPWADR